MKPKWLQKLFPLAAMFVLSTPLLFGQASNGSIVGSTSDAQGALIPGVNIVLKYPSNIADREMNVATDERGEFRFQAVPAGSGYTLRAELTGFRTAVISNIEVRPG